MDAWIVSTFCSELSPHRALRTGRCSRLDAWIVSTFCFELSPHRALKTGRCSRLDAWIVSTFCSELSPHRALKTGRCSRLDGFIVLQIVPAWSLKNWEVFWIGLDLFNNLGIIYLSQQKFLKPCALI